MTAIVLVALAASLLSMVAAAPPAAAAITIKAPWDGGKTFAVGNPPGSNVGGGYYGHCCTGYTTEYYAVDINGPGGGNTDCGEDIRATAPGKVIKIGTYSPSGISYVRIDHGGGYTSEYQHMANPPLVHEQDDVKQGDKIGDMSNIGTQYCHLHFVVKLNGTSIAPSPMSGTTLPASGGTWVTSDNYPSSTIPSTTFARRDLAFVKWAPTGSGRIEVHTATAASGYASFGVHAATPIGASDTNGVFDMADVNADGRADLVYIKRRNTGSGRIEVHWVSAATGYSSFGGNIATVFSAANDPNGSFEMADMNGDGRADLVFTKTRNTGSGRIELHWADAASGYARFGANLATAFSLADAGNGYFHPADMNADGRVDLAFVKIRNTGSARIEVHWANAAAGYGSFGGHYATALSGAERNNGWFETVDMNGDRAADLVFIKDYNIGSGRIELHWLDAGAGFSKVSLSAATAFSAAEAGHGFFTMMA
jgi:5-hydroxyisourate hydrolase-like protein (transthyretin family)